MPGCLFQRRCAERHTSHCALHSLEGYFPDSEQVSGQQGNDDGLLSQVHQGTGFQMEHELGRTETIIQFYLFLAKSTKIDMGWRWLGSSGSYIWRSSPPPLLFSRNSDTDGFLYIYPSFVS